MEIIVTAAMLILLMFVLVGLLTILIGLLADIKTLMNIGSIITFAAIAFFALAFVI